jgi:hypothetical protein
VLGGGTTGAVAARLFTPHQITCCATFAAMNKVQPPMSQVAG